MTELATRRSRGGTLTLAQETFARVFAQTGNMSEAYREGYPRSRNWAQPQSVASQAMRCLKNPLIRAKVREYRGERTEAAMWTAARTLLELAATAHEARAARQYGPAVRAYELIGKHLGMFGPADLQATTVNVQVNAAVAQLDIETLRALAARYDAIEAEASVPSAVYIEQAPVDASLVTDVSRETLEP